MGPCVILVILYKRLLKDGNGTEMDGTEMVLVRLSPKSRNLITPLHTQLFRNTNETHLKHDPKLHPNRVKSEKFRIKCSYSG
jgi:hypothetical protein